LVLPADGRSVEATGPGTNAGGITARNVRRPPPADPRIAAADRLFRRQRLIAVVGLPLFALAVASGLHALLSGQVLSGPSLVWLLLTVAMVVLFARMLMPSYRKRLLERMSASWAKPPEEVARENARRARRALAVLIPLVIAEVSIAAAFWPPPPEWVPYAGSAIGVSFMLLVVFAIMSVRWGTRFAGSPK
jgi:hypothetical protein